MYLTLSVKTKDSLAVNSIVLYVARHGPFLARVPRI